MNLTDQKSMKIIIFGGTGFIGRALIKSLQQQNWEIYVVTRNVNKATQLIGNKVNILEWDAQNTHLVANIFTGLYAIINLAGENIGNKLWTKKQKLKILESRVSVARAISEMINHSLVKPKIVIQSSATGYYGSDMDLIFDESSLKGKGFLADLTEQWEGALELDNKQKIRTVFIRTGLVLGRNEGLLAKLKIPFKFFFGGHFGNGKQWMSWIHIHDEVEAIKFLLLNEKSQGIYNLTAPEPVKMQEFCILTGTMLSRPSWLHIPSFILKFLPGNMAEEVLLSSQKIKPSRLLSEGFVFRYTHLEQALKDLLAQEKNA